MLTIPEVAPTKFREPEVVIAPPVYNFLAIAAPPSIVRAPSFVDDTASMVSLIPRPPDSKSPPVVEFVEATVLVEVIIPVKLLVVPTRKLFAIAAPPATVRAPPFVDDIASVVLLIPRPPDSKSPPVVEFVEATMLVEVIIPEKLLVVPTCKLFAIAAPPATVRAPPFVDDIASVVLLIPRPPDSKSPPVVEFVEATMLVEVIIPEKLLVVPTCKLFAIAAPPATVRAPPFVDDIASVVLLIPRPPDSKSPPVVEFVEATMLVEVIIPEK